MRKNVLTLAMTGFLAMAPCDEALAKPEAKPPNTIEIFVAGKRYASFKEYQKKRLKEALAGVLSHEEKSGSDAAQMQDMLNDYVKKHPTAQSFPIDPAKIKTIIVHPVNSNPVR